ncbi:hypothetical protein SIN8267_02692 [Sinobacterium norvegicum]|uniref:DUF58 domain-containing protein n=1 Tax=Sinobacterium norvegicum TaxID=1641715 RepID=A0ABM9AHT1_9GAMM|nr:DUF58 domain-containing protein [Sinobacterium norvegicum]CAH0992559.1 hypothetical protein SIN8267_02692 [Sinobacterium norvegicum]
MATAVLDNRIYSDYKTLLRLKSEAFGFSLSGRHRVDSVLAGRHQSRFRGRGLNFEELRHYQIGDDMRSFDWPVTLRTGKPHVRSYSEEKDNQVILVVDQRPPMFFSSVDTMKSVVAAEVASMMAWQVLADGDRVGAIVFNHQTTQWFRPQRSQHQVLRVLAEIARQNNLLSSDQQISADDNSLTQVLKKLYRQRLNAATIIFVGDWHQCDQTSLTLLKKLQQHNNILTTVISDPMEYQLPDAPNLVVSDGVLQLQIDQLNNNLGQRYSDDYQQQLRRLADVFKRQNIPLIHLDTGGDHRQQLRQYLGGRG